MSLLASINFGVLKLITHTHIRVFLLASFINYSSPGSPKLMTRQHFWIYSKCEGEGNWPEQHVPVESRHEVFLETVDPATWWTLVNGEGLQWHDIEVKLCQDRLVHAGYQGTRCVAIVLSWERGWERSEEGSLFSILARLCIITLQGLCLNSPNAQILKLAGHVYIVYAQLYLHACMMTFYSSWSSIETVGGVCSSSTFSRKYLTEYVWPLNI